MTQLSCNCGQNKDCCPFRKVVIPASAGDDSADSPCAPENGAYRNALVEYEANGAMYIYASDGIFTKVSMVAGGAGTASVQYVDSKVSDEASARVAGDNAVRAAIPTATSQLTNDSGFVETEHDPVFEASPAGSITAAKMTSWDNKSDFSGSYNDLTDKPTIPAAQVQADWAETSSSSKAFIRNKPVIPPGSVVDSYLDPTSENPVQNKVIADALNNKQGTLSTEQLAAVNSGITAAKVSTYDGYATTIAGKADSSSLAAVATSGSYNDLSNKPTIPAAQVNSDWNASSGKAQILNKPTLATVATSGSYNDLSNKPTIPAAQVNSDWNSASGVSQILNKPTLATVATSGAYSDLTGTPSVPVITMQNTDPGEGGTLAANNFIGVYQ